MTEPPPCRRVAGARPALACQILASRRSLTLAPCGPIGWSTEAHPWHCHRCRRSIWCLAPDTGL